MMPEIHGVPGHTGSSGRSSARFQLEDLPGESRVLADGYGQIEHREERFTVDLEGHPGRSPEPIALFARYVSLLALRKEEPPTNTSQDKSDLHAESVRKAQGESPGRLTGPIQFLLKLLAFWRLETSDAGSLLGFDSADAAHVAAVLGGSEEFRGRDVRDRISHLFWIRKTLWSLFRDLNVENEWLRESHSMLGGKSPLSLLLGGSMEDLLLVREYVDVAAGK